MAQRIRQSLTNNDLFGRVFFTAAALLALFGIGMTIIVLEGSNDTIGLRMVNIFAAAFASLVSFAAGFLFGSTAASVDQDKPAPPKSTV